MLLLPDNIQHCYVKPLGWLDWNQTMHLAFKHTMLEDEFQTSAFLILKTSKCSEVKISFCTQFVKSHIMFSMYIGTLHKAIKNI